MAGLTVIYVDTLFLLNAIVDYLLLLCSARLAGERLSRLRFALGALLGSFMSKGALQNAALVGAGAVAWNFYQKWSQSQKESQPAEPAPVQQPVAAVAPAELDPTARLCCAPWCSPRGRMDISTRRNRIVSARSSRRWLPVRTPMPSWVSC